MQDTLSVSVRNALKTNSLGGVVPRSSQTISWRSHTSFLAVDDNIAQSYLRSSADLQSTINVSKVVSELHAAIDDHVGQESTAKIESGSRKQAH